MFGAAVVGLATSVGWLTRENAALSGLWGHLIIRHDSGTALSTLLCEHFALWLVLYSACHFLMYLEPGKSWFHPFKLNKRYPASSLVRTEMARSARGVFIGTVETWLVFQLHERGALPLWQQQGGAGGNATAAAGGAAATSAVAAPASFLVPDPDPLKLGLLTVVLGVLFVVIWGDTHFYFTHRLMHTKWLYRNVHKVRFVSV
jgi:sterol desaturase/sphingolipid hydroxylase (fatty acid hydroxylase superfamily)